MFSAFYEVAIGRAPIMFRAYLLAVLIQMFGVNGLAELGYLRAEVPPFFGIATLLGGLVYGWGMFLAIGCAGAVLYRAGEGKFNYMVAMLGYILAAWASNNGLTQTVRAFVGSNPLTLTLHQAMAIDRPLIVAILLMLGALWVMRGARAPYDGGWDWTRTGFAIGLIGIVAWMASAMTGKPAGLGTMQGGDSLATFLLERDLSALNWGMLLLIGIPIGSVFAAWRHGVSSAAPLRFDRLPQALAGGILMGAGAAIAAGDNMLHGLSGVPLLSVGSLVFMLCAFIGVAMAVRLKESRY